MSESVVGPRSGLRWVSLSEIETVGSAESRSAGVFRVWADWFLTLPCDELGRDGPVCPFVRPSMTRDLLWIGHIPGPRPRLDLIRTIIADALEVYPTLPTGNGSSTSVLRAMITVFPDLIDCAVIDAIHSEFKSKFVEQGNMLGQFYPGCEQPGLWNKDFRPLDAPLPMLVVRSMMTTDFPFLLERPECRIRPQPAHQPRGARGDRPDPRGLPAPPRVTAEFTRGNYSCVVDCSLPRDAPDRKVQPWRRRSGSMSTAMSMC